MIFILIQDTEESTLDPEFKQILLIVLCVIIMVVTLGYFYFLFEQFYVRKYRKPFFRNRAEIKRKLSEEQRTILNNQFTFYKYLSKENQSVFEHRVSKFIDSKVFVGREGLEITNEVLVLVSATAIMLTFGFRNYLIELVNTIVIYPNAFYSSTNKEFHKGEFNPQYETLVLSWKDFKQGYDIANDNLNLGVHEFAHAIHLSCIKHKGINTIMFNESFMELADYLSENEIIKEALINSKYFRDYAYTNQFEFVAVIIENFIETPKQFKFQFPFVYNKVKQMLNFDFAGY